MSTIREIAEAFARLFAGLDRVHGRYVVPTDARPDAKGKIAGKAWTAHEPLGLEDLVAHLSGEEVSVKNGDGRLVGALGIGVCPIRDDATCVFGAIDVDVYPLDLKKLVADVISLELPLVVCRTKSGGAHLYLFMREPAAAELVRSKLMDWAVALGFPGVEVFPKQTKLASKKDEGNWINLPYQGGSRSTRYALKRDGSAIMNPLEFVRTAEAAAVTPAWLEAFSPPAKAAEALGADFLDGPPCLQTLARKGFGDWQNNGLFNVAVYLRKKHGIGWEERIEDYNRKLMDPPVPAKDVVSTIKSVNKKSYSYMCKQEPICGVCNRQVCLTREYGVGGSGDDPGVVFGEILKIETDPPVWIWDVDGARIEMDIKDIMDQRRFHVLAIEKLNKWPNLVKPLVWQGIVRERLARIKTVKVPEDATRRGQLWVQLARFCTQKGRGKVMDDLLLGRPYTDPKGGRTYFAAADFLQYLQQHRFFGVTEKELYTWMRERQLDHHYSKLKGKGINYWSVPSFPEQTEEHAVPRGEQEEPM